VIGESVRELIPKLLRAGASRVIEYPVSALI